MDKSIELRKTGGDGEWLTWGLAKSRPSHPLARSRKPPEYGSQALGASHLFGLSTQTTAYQKEAAERLHLPFALLSDSDFRLLEALRLPTFEIAGMRLLKRLTMMISEHRIEHVFYPVFPPDRSASDVIDWLQFAPLNPSPVSRRQPPIFAQHEYYRFRPKTESLFSRGWRKVATRATAVRWRSQEIFA